MKSRLDEIDSLIVKVMVPLGIKLINCAILYQALFVNAYKNALQLKTYYQKDISCLNKTYS